ncbi:MAG TPA: hypothetical protein V6C99_11840 [Oculatellaceae cyanobacterium]|jgi:hypothetical protein
MTKAELLARASLGNSVFQELIRDFRITRRAAKRVLGDKHLLTIACIHASIFPTDRMSLHMVWDQFEALTCAQRNEILQIIRTRTV